MIQIRETVTGNGYDLLLRPICPLLFTLTHPSLPLTERNEEEDLKTSGGAFAWISTTW